MNVQRHLLLMVTLAAAAIPASGQQVLPEATPIKIAVQSSASIPGKLEDSASRSDMKGSHTAVAGAMQRSSGAERTSAVRQPTSSTPVLSPTRSARTPRRSSIER